MMGLRGVRKTPLRVEDRGVTVMAVGDDVVCVVAVVVVPASSTFVWQEW